MDCQERICFRSLFQEAIGQLLKVLVRLMPACMPALLTGYFFFVTVSVAGGQVPQHGKAQIQQLVKQLAQQDFEQRESAERQLIEIGSPAVCLLYTSPSPRDS